MTTKEQITEAANHKSIYSDHPGSFVYTDGEWCMTRNPAEFKAFLERRFGFSVIECKSTKYSTAVATTACGLEIAWNGFCRKL